MNTLGEFTLSTPDHFQALSGEDRELLSVMLDGLITLPTSESGDTMFNIRGLARTYNDAVTVTLVDIWALPEQQVEYLSKGGSPEASGFVKSDVLEAMEYSFNWTLGIDVLDEETV